MIKPWPEWLADNPCPDLQGLIERFGSYDTIPRQAWEEYDRQVAEWTTRYKSREWER